MDLSYGIIRRRNNIKKERSSPFSHFYDVHPVWQFGSSLHFDTMAILVIQSKTHCSQLISAAGPSRFY